MELRKILLKVDEYLRIPSVVGFEQPFLDFLAEDFAPFGAVRRHRGLLAVLPRRVSPAELRKLPVLTAHVDRHGLVLNRQGCIEYAAFYVRRRHGEAVSISRTGFQRSGPRFVGQRMYAYHPKTGKRRGSCVVTAYTPRFATRTLFFAVAGIRHLPPETPLAYESVLHRLRDRISSQLDNVLSVAILRQLAEEGFRGTILLSTEEEIGRSWQHMAGFLLQRGMGSASLITLDTTPCTDTGVIEDGKVALRNRDGIASFDRRLVGLMKSVCREEGVGYVVKDELIEREGMKWQLPSVRYGRTELGWLLKNAGRLRGGVLQCPSLNYHTNYETTTRQCVENMYRVISSIIPKL